MKKKIHFPGEDYLRTEGITENKENSPEMEAINNMEADIQPSEEEKSQTLETDKVVDVLKATEEKLAEVQDKYVRLSAEFDNYRKRTLREKMDMVRFSGEEMLLKIIPFMDDFDRALLNMDITSEGSAMKSGIELIYNKFSEFLKLNGVKEIEALDKDFNVDLHEAVAKMPVTEEEKKGKVIDVIQKGYFLQDKVIRFSKVVVGE